MARLAGIWRATSSAARRTNCFRRMCHRPYWMTVARFRIHLRKTVSSTVSPAPPSGPVPGANPRQDLLHPLGSKRWFSDQPHPEEAQWQSPRAGIHQAPAWRRLCPAEASAHPRRTAARARPNRRRPLAWHGGAGHDRRAGDELRTRSGARAHTKLTKSQSACLEPETARVRAFGATPSELRVERTLFGDRGKVDKALNCRLGDTGRANFSAGIPTAKG